MKYSIYFNEYNIPTGNSYFLPLVSGMLAAYLDSFNEVSEKFVVKKTFFKHQQAHEIIAEYDSPSLAFFSVFMWNEQLCLTIARELKKKWPDCLIVFGGAQIPHNSTHYLQENPSIDIGCRGEGENQFISILTSFLNNKDFSNVHGITYKDCTGNIHYNELDYPAENDLRRFPSPYCSGKFDQLILENPNIEFKAIIETNRGCPFHCAYCYWGGLSNKMRLHPIEKVYDEIDWCAKNKIEYVFCADSNFGMFTRDIEIAKKLKQSKEQFNYPQKFRACYGKNCEQHVCDVAQILDKSGLCKSMTLSLQSTNPEALENVGRKNITDKYFSTVQKNMNINKVPVYTELILGLPGETYTSWIKGLDKILSNGLNNQLFIYLCQVYVNSTLGSIDYQKKFSIETTKIELQEIHATPRNEGIPIEYQHIITSTYSMSNDDWKKMVKASWVLMTLFSLKIAYYIISYLKNKYKISYLDILKLFTSSALYQNTQWGNVLNFFEIKTYNILKGEGLGQTYKNLLISYDVEECAFLQLSENWENFYSEIKIILRDFLHKNNYINSTCVDDEIILDELFEYQEMCMPKLTGYNTVKKFSYDWYTFFTLLAEQDEHTILAKKEITVSCINQENLSLDDYARNIILYGRKSDKIINKHILL